MPTAVAEARAAPPACGTEIAPHHTGVAAECYAAGWGLITIVGDHQEVECEQSSRTIIVIVGDNNTVSCTKEA